MDWLTTAQAGFAFLFREARSFYASQDFCEIMMRSESTCTIRLIFSSFAPSTNFAKEEANSQKG